MEPARTLSALLLLMVSSPAVAAPSGSPRLTNEARADLLFHSGEKKFDGGDYAGACADFGESLKLGPKLGTLLNLALCHETIGKLVTAWSEYSHAAAWAAQNNQRDRHEFATAHIRALEPKLPRIVLQLPAERPIESIDLDGEPVPEPHWYMPLYLDPGEHRLGLSAPGSKRSTVAFRVTASPTEQLVMVPPLPTDYSSLSPTTTIDPSRKLLGLVGLGLGAAGAVVGTAFGVLAMTGDPSDHVQRDATVATVAFVSGAAFAITGGWLLWTSTARGHAAAPSGVRVGIGAMEASF